MAGRPPAAQAVQKQSTGEAPADKVSISPAALKAAAGDVDHDGDSR
jgi:hypothetical protein